MAKLFDSATGARVVIVSADHCPPHVHAVHKGEGWVVRVSFSFAGPGVAVLDIAPSGQAVRQRSLNQLLGEVEAHHAACRRLWWESMGVTCLDNRWVAEARPGAMLVVAGRRAGARQVQSSTYDGTSGTATLRFRDGTEGVIHHGA